MMLPEFMIIYLYIFQILQSFGFRDETILLNSDDDDDDDDDDDLKNPSTFKSFIFHSI